MKRRNTFLGVIAAAVLTAAVVSAADHTPLTMDTCAMCHDEVAAAFAAGPHGRAMAARSKDMLERSCAACHQPTAAHIDDPSPQNVHKTPPRGACTACHASMAAGLELTTPGHPRNGVRCLDCHASGHHDPGTPHLLRKAPNTLCASCHPEEAASFSMPYAHRNGQRGAVSCLSCHSIHGRHGENAMRHLLGNGGVCITCHAGKAGPFIYPHPPRVVNGCVACHEPHGSMNPFQLRRHRVMDLCLECHADVPAFHDLSQARYRACTDCHVAVHGSNRDPLLLQP